MNGRIVWHVGTAIAGLALAAVAIAQPVTPTHVHGLAYSADGKRLLIPSHHGLAIYENGRWAKAAGPQHDYMAYPRRRKTSIAAGTPKRAPDWSIRSG